MVVPAGDKCYRGSSGDFSVTLSLLPFVESDTRICSILGLYTIPAGRPGFWVALSPKVKNWCMLINTMLTPIKKFIVSLWPNRAQLVMAVKIVAMVLLYFLRIVSANCSSSSSGSTKDPVGPKPSKPDSLSMRQASSISNLEFAHTGLTGDKGEERMLGAELRTACCRIHAWFGLCETSGLCSCGL